MRAAIALVFFLSAAAVPARSARAGDDLPVPRGTRAASSDGGGALVSGQGFGATVDFIGKELARRGLSFHRLGPYRARGVDVARFVSEDDRGAWRAIHVWRLQGKTWISFVKRAP